MTAGCTTEKLKLITVIAAAELWNRLQAELVALGVRDYTFMSVDGFGEHGRRERGLLLVTSNVRVETIIRPELGDVVLKHLVVHYSRHELLAYASEVERSSECVSLDVLR